MEAVPWHGVTDAHLLLALAEGFDESPVAALLRPDVDPAMLLAAPPAPPDIPPKAAARLRLADLAERARAVRDRATALGLTTVTRNEPGWPTAIDRLPNAPLVLFVRGDLAALRRGPAATFVGSRTPTPYGVDAAQQIGRALSSCGVTLWSGLARGIDAIAHEAALRDETPTVAVLAGGLDHVYPTEHAALANRIVDQGGCVLSELPLGRRARRGHFIRRNRILAAASPAVVVVEGSLTSGALHTARIAAECGADVHCVPGPWLSERSQGCHRLISEGAAIVESVEALLQGLGMATRSTTAALRLTRNAEEQAVLRQLTSGPRPTDLIQREARVERKQLLRALFALQQRGAIDSLPGGLWCALAVEDSKSPKQL